MGPIRPRLLRFPVRPKHIRLRGLGRTVRPPHRAGWKAAALAFEQTLRFERSRRSVESGSADISSPCHLLNTARRVPGSVRQFHSD
jgi:hypothetical protein